MSDQTPTVGEVKASPSIGVEDYFGVDPANTTNKEEVKPAADTAPKSEDKKDGSEKTTDKPTPAGKDEKVATEDKKTTDTKDKDGEDKSKTDDKKSEKKDDAQPTEFEVAGTKYSTFDDAIKAVNRINGDNSRLVGDNKTLKAETAELQNNLKEISKLMESYKEANQAWKDYYENGGDKPDETTVKIEETITKKLKEADEQKKTIALTEQYDKEMDEILAKPDYEEIKPFLIELIDEYKQDGIKTRISPLKLYARAKKLAQKEPSADDIDIDKLAEEKAEKLLAKREAAKNGSEAGGAGKETTKKELPPEVADYFNTIM